MKKLLKNILFAAAVAAFVPAALGQVAAYAGNFAYQSDNLVATNFYLTGGTAAATVTVTNLVSANYYVGQNPNIPAPGNGLFVVPPCAAIMSIEAIYQQYTNDPNGYNPTNDFNPVLGQGTNIVAIFQPLQGDTTLQWLGKLTVPTNSLLFTVNVPTQIASTNGLALATASFSTTNFNGCKYGRLIGFSGMYTNAYVFRQFRVGAWAPSR